jgi:hypothetical protein
VPPTTRAPIPRTEELPRRQRRCEWGPRPGWPVSSGKPGLAEEVNGERCPCRRCWRGSTKRTPWNAALKQTAEAGSVLVPSYVRRAI